MDLRIHHSLPETFAKLPRRLLEVPKMLLYSDYPERGNLGGEVRRQELGKKRKHSLLGRGSWESTENRPAGRPALLGGKVREGKEFQ